MQYSDIKYSTLGHATRAHHAFRELDGNADGVLSGEERTALAPVDRVRVTALTAELPVASMASVIDDHRSWVGVAERKVYVGDVAATLGWTDDLGPARASALIDALRPVRHAYCVGGWGATLVRPTTVTEVSKAMARGLAPRDSATLVTVESPLTGRAVVVEVIPEKLLEVVEVTDRRTGATRTAPIPSREPAAIGARRVVSVGNPSATENAVVTRVRWAEAHLQDAIDNAAAGRFLLANAQLNEADSIIAPVSIQAAARAQRYQTKRDVTAEIVQRLHDLTGS